MDRRVEVRVATLVGGTFIAAGAGGLLVLLAWWPVLIAVVAAAGAVAAIRVLGARTVVHRASDTPPPVKTTADTTPWL